MSTYRTAMRTHACGELTAEHVDAPVGHSGWVATRTVQRGVTIKVMRGRGGVVEVVLHTSVV
jgi:aspartyl-tRNA synthetase